MTEEATILNEKELAFLSDEILKNDKVVEKIAQYCARNLKRDTEKTRKSVVGRIKSELERFAADQKREHENAISTELRVWAEEHLRRTIEASKPQIIQKLKVQVSNWLESNIEQRFRYVAKQVADDLIKEKFADTKLTFSIRDLFPKERDW